MNFHKFSLDVRRIISIEEMPENGWEKTRYFQNWCTNLNVSSMLALNHIIKNENQKLWLLIDIVNICKYGNLNPNDYFMN